MVSVYGPARFAGVQSKNWAAFAEPMSRIYNAEIHGTIFFGFGSYINSGAIRSWVEVGRYSSIGRHVSLGLGHHNMSGFSTSPFFEDSFPPSSFPFAKQDPQRRCVVGNDCWIGDRVMIVSGVTIGDGAVVAAGAVVAKDVMPYEIVGGVPAKHIGWRFDEVTRMRLLNLSWWEYEPSEIRRLAAPDIQDFLAACETYLPGAGKYAISYRRYTADQVT